MIVVDASATVDLLLGDARVLGALSDAEMHVPEVWSLEVLQALRRLEREGRVAPHRTAEAVATMQDLDVHRHGHGPLEPRIWALRGHVSAYDAAYLALAESLEAGLLTHDGRLAGAAKSLVELVDG